MEMEREELIKHLRADFLVEIRDEEVDTEALKLKAQHALCGNFGMTKEEAALLIEEWVNTK